MFDIDITTFISPALRQRSIDATLDSIIKLGQALLNEQSLAQLRTLHTDNAFLLAFEQALERGGKHFVQVYLDEDEDLVEAIVDHGGFFAHEQVQQAFLSLLQKPSDYFAEGQEVVSRSFDDVLPRRRNRKRVNRAMNLFLTCLAQEVWRLPQLRSTYDLIALTPSPSPNIRRGEFSFPKDNSDQNKLYHNLPTPDYERFVGRKTELAQVQELLLPSTRHFAITIDGIGGIGKSALALEMAHRYRRDVGTLPATERFDAIIWATAKQSLLTGQGIVTRPQLVSIQKAQLKADRAALAVNHDIRAALFALNEGLAQQNRSFPQNSNINTKSR